MFAGELVRILPSNRLDYRQVRKLLVIVRGSAALDDGLWARFSFRDIVAIRAALKLAGDKRNPYKGRRLMLAEVARACEVLRDRYDIADPITTVRLRWSGAKLVAQFHGIHFEPASGQLLLEAKEIDAVVRRLPTDDQDDCKQAIRRCLTKSRRRVAACDHNAVQGLWPIGDAR